VCGRKIPVGPDNDCAKLGLWGMFDKFGVAIGYRPGITGRDLADTVLHEAIHALSEYVVCGDDRLSERQVHALSNGLCGMLAANPKLVELIVDDGT